MRAVVVCAVQASELLHCMRCRFVARNKYTLRVVNNAGHWLPLEAPYTINNLLLDFIPKAVKLPVG